MILSDQDIKKYLTEDWRDEDGVPERLIDINPCNLEDIQPASYELHLGNQLSYPYYDDPVGTNGDTEYWLGPGQFILGTTKEEISLSPYIAAELRGKSSLGRLGLSIHSTAGWIDPGFKGQITLELKNDGFQAIILKPGMKIGQIVFMYLTSKSLKPYGSEGLGSHYQNQRGPTRSELSYGIEP